MVIDILLLVSIVTTLIYAADLLSQYLYTRVGPGSTLLKAGPVEIPHNARWFFIHALTNGIVALAGSHDLVYCLGNVNTCAGERWSDSSFTAFMIAIVCHLYHIIFFWSHLTQRDWIHHSIMIGLCAPLCLLYPSRAGAVALCFLTGYPGMIDYFLLWCVKMRWVELELERLCNVWINVWIRSPGCLFTCFLTLPILGQNNLSQLILPLILIMLVFWNGQYYMMLTVRDYGKRISLRKTTYKNNN